MALDEFPVERDGLGRCVLPQDLGVKDGGLSPAGLHVERGLRLGLGELLPARDECGHASA